MSEPYIVSRDRTAMISLRKLLDTIEFQRRFRLAELNHDIMVARKKYSKHIERAALLKRVGYLVTKCRCFCLLKITKGSFTLRQQQHNFHYFGVVAVMNGFNTHS